MPGKPLMEMPPGLEVTEEAFSGCPQGDGGVCQEHHTLGCLLMMKLNAMPVAKEEVPMSQAGKRRVGLALRGWVGT